MKSFKYFSQLSDLKSLIGIIFFMYSLLNAINDKFTINDSSLYYAFIKE